MAGNQSMRVQIIAVGRLKAGAERELVARYFDRAVLSARAIGIAGVDLREIGESQARRPEDRKAEEARAIAALLPAGARVLALDERGKATTSAAFATDMGASRDRGLPVFALAIGGPDGLDPAFADAAAGKLAFGAMTWPHQLVRVMAVEQVYRAMTILGGHPYHRA